MNKVEDRMEPRRKQGNVTKNEHSFVEKTGDREEYGTPRCPPTMMTIRVPTDMMDKETITETNLYKESCSTNNGQSRDNLEQLEMIQDRMHNDPERGKLELTATQLHGGKDTDGNNAD